MQRLLNITLHQPRPKVNKKVTNNYALDNGFKLRHQKVYMNNNYMNHTSMNSGGETPTLGQSRCNLEVLPIEMKHCLYSRESTEDDEKHALSIDSQIMEMIQMAVHDNIPIKEIRQESHSAKDSGQRPVFNKLIQGIKKDVFNGILCWAPDRLSRNAGDLGQ